MSKPREQGDLGAAKASVPSVKEILDGVDAEAGLLGAYDDTSTPGQGRMLRHTH